MTAATYAMDSVVGNNVDPTQLSKAVHGMAICKQYISQWQTDAVNAEC